ncbi:S-adenosyl-L-methionine-dependent methyltransferase [Dichotomocladium elegans]|nr:S-adenosyl-L-methionine-dependent methyltransferase [Dichotomocladium elegans]
MSHQKNHWVYEYGEEKEYNRQLRQHYILKQVFAGNAHVPMDNVHDILECACGTGLWALEVAQAHPNCNVVGIDIVPPTNERSGLPSQGIPDNVTYQHVDLLTALPQADCSFDYVYERDVAHIMPIKQWPVLIKEFYRIIRPGGFLELVEYDILFRNPGPVLALVNEWYKIAASTLGVDPGYAESIPTFLREGGFEEVQVKVYDIPIGEWPTDPVQRRYGFLYKEQMKTLFKSMQRWWLSELDVSEDEYVKVCNAAIDEFDEYHSIARWKIVTARKPLNDEIQAHP